MMTLTQVNAQPDKAHAFKAYVLSERLLLQQSRLVPDADLDTCCYEAISWKYRQALSGSRVYCH